MDVTKAVSIVIAGVLTLAAVDTLMVVSPAVQAGLHAVRIRLHTVSLPTIQYLPHAFTCTSSYGPEKRNNGIKPTPDTATRGPDAFRTPCSQIGRKRTSSYSLCWIWCSSASRCVRFRSVTCCAYQASISGS